MWRPLLWVLTTICITHAASTQLESSSKTDAQSTSSSLQPSPMAQSQNQTRGFFKLLLSRPANHSMTWYTANFVTGDDSLDLQVDIGSSKIWAMSSLAFNSCSLEAAKDFGGDGWYLFNSTRDPATFCAIGGVFTSNSSDAEESAFGFVDTIYPLLNGTGSYVLSNFSVPLVDSRPINMNRAAFLDVNDTFLFYGGLGLAQAVPAEPMGFLGDLVSSGIIFSDSYSLWFGGSHDSQSDFGQLMPGIIDKLFYTGNLYAYSMIAQYLIDESGTYVYHPSPKLPIVALNDVEVLNPLNGKLVLLKTDSEPVPVLWTSNTEMSFLPLAILVQLAIQVSAFYSEQYNRWIVSCQALQLSKAQVQLTFGPLKISVPIGEFVALPPSNATAPTLPNGDNACFLNVMSSNFSGSNLLGLSVLRYVYLAVDNESNKIAMASAARLDLDSSSVASMVATATVPVITCTTLNISSPTVGGTIAYIRSGSIPFATSLNFSTIVPPYAFQPKVWPANSSIPAWLPEDYNAYVSTAASLSNGDGSPNTPGNTRLSGMRLVPAAWGRLTPAGLDLSLLIITIPLILGVFAL